MVATVPAGDGPKSITLVGNRLWVANELDGSITVVDPGSRRAVKRIATGASVRGLATDGKSGYVTTRSVVAGGHRGGTLHITTAPLFVPNVEGIDPSYAEDAFVFSAYSLVYDGLVGLQRASGGAGLTLVPDLAVDLPRPSPDGLSYTFRLRRGIHYSDGRSGQTRRLQSGPATAADRARRRRSTDEHRRSCGLRPAQDGVRSDPWGARR